LSYIEPYGVYQANKLDREQLMKKDLQIPSDIGNLRLVEKAIDELSLELNLSDEIYGNVMVATMEATNNAIIHGNNSDPRKNVKIQILLEEKELNVHVEDQGLGFDYENVPDPTSPENLEKINGRGIFLMEHLSDEIVYREEGRIVVLKFRL
jgi:serine/threonine-protein kinase RsbW